MNNVFITGTGTINPLGHNNAETWAAVMQGICGIGPITHYDTEKRKVTLAGEIKAYDPGEFFDVKEARHIDPFIQYALIAAREAVADAGLSIIEDPYRVGVIVSSGIGGIGTIEAEHSKALEKDAFDRVTPFFIPKIINNMAAGYIAMDIGAKGVCEAVTTACASSTNAIGNAYRLIRDGYMDVMICGGTEASITPLSMGGFTSMKALSTATDPKRASIPFDLERSGFVMGEGAAILVLESEAHAKTRGAKALAEVVGYGATCDAHHITAPDPSGEAVVRAMTMALDEANARPEDLDYINCHGTSTKLNDSTESDAIGILFGEEVEKQPYASSTKSMTGHLLGAAGALEAILSAYALHDQVLPVNLGYQVPDPDCAIRVVKECGQKAPLNLVMSNNLGFGGHNASLVLRKVDDAWN